MFLFYGGPGRPGPAPARSRVTYGDAVPPDGRIA